MKRFSKKNNFIAEDSEEEGDFLRISKQDKKEFKYDRKAFNRRSVDFRKASESFAGATDGQKPPRGKRVLHMGRWEDMDK